MGRTRRRRAWATRSTCPRARTCPPLRLDRRRDCRNRPLVGVMDRILTLTLNPTLDLATAVDAVVAGPKLRCDAPEIDPGGGGINVSRAVRILGGRSTAFAVSGGPTGEMLEHLLRGEGIAPVVLQGPGATHESFSVTDRATGAQYRFVLPGPPWRKFTAGGAGRAHRRRATRRHRRPVGPPATRRRRRFPSGIGPRDGAQVGAPCARHLGPRASPHRRTSLPPPDPASADGWRRGRGSGRPPAARHP